MVLLWDLGFSKGLQVCMDLWMTIGAVVVVTLRQKALLSPSVRWWHHIHPAGDHHDEGVQAQKHSGLLGHLPQVCPIHFWTFLIGWWIHVFITVFLHLTLILRSPTFSFYICIEFSASEYDSVIVVCQKYQTVDLYGVLWWRITPGYVSWYVPFTNVFLILLLQVLLCITFYCNTL